MNSFSSIKNAEVYKFLVDNKIFLTTHELTTNQTARMAIITKKHTKITNIFNLADNLRLVIHKHLTANHGDNLPEGLTSNLASQLFIKTETVKHSVPDHSDDTNKKNILIESTVFCVYTNKEHAAALGNYLANEDIFPEPIFGHWVPWTARLDKEIFASKLREHNAYQEAVRVHTLEGVTKEMMDATYTDPNTDKVYSSCYEAIHEIRQELWHDENDNEISEPDYIEICDAPEPTKDTNTKGRWLVPYTGDPIESTRVLQQMIHQWSEMIPTNEPKPTLNPKHNKPSASDISKQYLETQRQHSNAHRVYTGNQYNRGRLPNRNRPPATVDIDNNSHVHQPSWAAVAQNGLLKTPPTHQKKKTTPWYHPSDTTDATFHPAIPTPSPNPTQFSRKVTFTNDSQSSVDTTTTTRTDMASIIHQMNQDHQTAMRAYQVETERKLSELEARITVQFKQREETEAVRDERYESMHNSVCNSIAQMAAQMTDLIIRLGASQPHQANPTEPETTHDDSNLSDMEMMAIEVPGEFTPPKISGNKRTHTVRTPYAHHPELILHSKQEYCHPSKAPKKKPLVHNNNSSSFAPLPHRMRAARPQHE